MIPNLSASSGCSSILTLHILISTAASSISFIIGATEYSVPIGKSINVDEELKKLQDELDYYNRFLDSVRKKLSNEKFVANAPEKIVELERKKEADALEKIGTINAAIQSLTGI